MLIQVKLRKWGNSMGIVIPSEILRENSLKEGEDVIIEIKKKEGMRKIFGSLRNLKIDSQKMKDELRMEWGKRDEILS